MNEFREIVKANGKTIERIWRLELGWNHVFVLVSERELKGVC